MGPKRKWTVALSCPALCLTLAAGVPDGAAAQTAPSVEQADAHLAAGRFAEAAASYEALVAADPRDGRAWFRLGFSRHALGLFHEAIAAFERAEPLHPLPQTVAYRIARSHARLGEAEQALAWLERATSRGFNQADQLRDDPDLEALRGEPRFAAVLVAAAREANPCALDPAYRAADFMVGEWEVFHHGRPIGRARIAPAVGGCAVVEEYSQPELPGADGRVTTFLDPQGGRWRQIYVDASGNVNDLAGEPTATGLALTGEYHPRRGETQRMRVVLERLPGGGFRQLSEQSRDGGETWNPLYDIQYRPPVPSAGS